MSDTWNLFRYRPVNQYLWQELELNELYCSPPEHLNDPFDCRVDWKNALRRALSATISDHRRKRLLQMQEAFTRRSPYLEGGICCFSIKVDDHLMWSHYADSHRGVCLLYEIPKDYLHSRYPPNDNASESDIFFVGGSQIFYGDDAFYEWLITGDHNSPIDGNPIENAVSRIFCTKAKQWSHEEEWRIVSSQPGPLGIEPAFLKQVTFGFAMPPRQRTLIERVAKRNNPRVVIGEVKQSGLTDFGLDFPEIMVETGKG